MSYTLGNIVAGLPSKGGGRQNWGTTTDGSVGIVAAQQVVMEITETAELEELKYQTPVPPSTPLQMTAGNPIVPISTILGTIPTNTNYPQFQAVAAGISDITDCYDSWMWFTSAGTPAAGVNQSGRILKYRRIPALDMYTYGVTSNQQTSFGVAPPTYFSRFGSNLQVGPSPDQAYFYFFRTKLRHPWPSSSLASAPIFAPDSWMQVFQYAAIYQLACDEGISDQSFVSTAKNYLESRRMAPWQLRKLQMERDEMHNERAISLRTSVYTFR